MAEKDTGIGKYELLYIVHPDLESSIDKITGRVKEAIESRKGKISYEENWGKRKLAYPIRKSEVGIYVLNYFEAPKDILSKIEREIRLTEEIMRFMVLAVSEKTKKASTPKKEKKEVTSEKPAAEKAPKKEKLTKEEEAERLKKLDEKLGAILGDEGDNKKEAKAKAKPKEK
jgi:small subunit ribosomal protein S6